MGETIYKNNSEFESDRQFDLENCSLIEARGFILQSLLPIESLIDKAIINFLEINKEKETVFYKIFLDTSNIDLGKKNRILRGLDVIDNKQFDKITDLIRIRNAFAHAKVNTHIQLEVNKEKNESSIVSIDSYIHTLASNGKAKSEKAKKLIGQFIITKKEVGDFLYAICFGPNSKK